MVAVKMPLCVHHYITNTAAEIQEKPLILIHYDLTLFYIQGYLIMFAYDSESHCMHLPCPFPLPSLCGGSPG